MCTTEKYQDKAARCSHLAQAITDPDSKAMLLEMAQTWIKLAEYERAKTQEERD